MKKNKIISSAIVTCGLIVGLTGTVLATDASKIQPRVMESPQFVTMEASPEIIPVALTTENIAPIKVVENYDALLERQTEIDKYIFETNKGEFKEAGFKVSTSWVNPETGEVEIGIVPYSEESVKFLENIFKNDKLNVIEGTLVTTFGDSATSGMIETTVAPDMTPYETTSAPVEEIMPVSAPVEDVTTTVATEEKGDIVKLVPYVLVGAVLGGAGVFLAKKKK